MSYVAKRLWSGVLLTVLLTGLVGPATARAQEAKPTEGEGASSSPPVVLPEGAVPRLVRLSGLVRLAEGQTGKAQAKPWPRTLVITFGLYKDQEGGVALWEETQAVTVAAGGRYTVLLGAKEELPQELFTGNEARWLGVRPEGSEEQARVLLVSVPYALKAADAETLGGKPLSEFVLAKPGKEGSEREASQGLEGKLKDTGALPKYLATGTVNFIPKFTSGSDASGQNMGNSILFESSGKIGLGTTSPVSLLHLSATSPEFRLTSTSSASIPQLSFYDGATLGGVFQYRNSGVADPNIFRLGGIASGSQFAVVTSGTEKLRVNAAGNVGIGTTTPGAILHLSSTSPELRLTSTSSASIPQLSFYDGATLGGFFQYRNSGVSNPNVFSLGGKVAGSQFAIFTGGAEKVRVTAAGNVGIGTTTPGQKLTVAGMVESTSGGFKFPNGSVQTSAVANTAQVRGITFLLGCETCGALTDGDDQPAFYANVLGIMTINSVTCYADAGTPLINLQRDDGSPANLLVENLACNGVTTMGIIPGESVLNVNDKLNFVMIFAGGTAKRVTLAIKATVM